MTDRNDIFFETPEFIPPDDIVIEVNPFKKALNRILTGIALCAITLNFLQLNYILPFVGMLLMLSGLRTLKRENKWFYACFCIVALRLTYFCATLLINTTIYHESIYSSHVMIFISSLNNLLLFAFIAIFGKALRTVQKKASLPVGTGGITFLFIWYVILFILAISGISGTPLAILMLIALAFIIYSLYDISTELDEAGYIIEPSPVKIHDPSFCSMICALLIFGGICGYHFFGSYSMDWHTESSVVQENVKIHLKELGFPEEILDDLSEEDLLSCKDALFVEVETQLHPVNDGRAVTKVKSDTSGRTTYFHSTVYDRKELSITSVAVLLSKERPYWKIFHHFTWEITPRFYGTECIRINPAYNFNTSRGWSDAGGISGQVLYDYEGTTYTAPYKYLGRQKHTADDMFFGEHTSEDIYATFSMPNEGTKHRGYVSYTTAENQPGWILSSWISYTHRKDFFQYPNSTGMDENFKGILNKSDAYISIQDAIQFFPNKAAPTD